MRPSEALDKIPSGSLGELPLLIKVNTTLVPIFPFCPSLPGGPVLPSAPVSPLGPEEKKKNETNTKSAFGSVTAPVWYVYTFYSSCWLKGSANDNDNDAGDDDDHGGVDLSWPW